MKHDRRLRCAVALAVLGLAGTAAADRGGGAVAARAGRAILAGDREPLLVVIDPGHGGSNTGAPSVADGVFEKHVTLALALELRHRLEAHGARVVLTRDRDVYLTLRQRIDLANALDADLFVSVHANATEAHTQRGYETFVLTPAALDADARALRPDATLARSGIDRELAALIDDVERGAVVPLAGELAGRIQERMRAELGADRDRGIRQDAMHVLFGATMPAVLVEVGFIDHAIEGPELLDPAGRTKISRALADAIAGPTQPR